MVRATAVLAGLFVSSPARQCCRKRGVYATAREVYKCIHAIENYSPIRRISGLEGLDLPKEARRNSGDFFK